MGKEGGRVINMAQEDGEHGEGAGNGKIAMGGRGRMAYMVKELARERADKVTVISHWIEAWRESVRVKEEARGKRGNGRRKGSR